MEFTDYDRQRLNELYLKEAFGEYDYERLKDTDTDVERLNLVVPSRKKMAEALISLMNEGKLYIMDKRHGFAYQASVVLGYRGDSLVICCEE